MAASHDGAWVGSGFLRSSCADSTGLPASSSAGSTVKRLEGTATASTSAAALMPQVRTCRRTKARGLMIHLTSDTSYLDGSAGSITDSAHRNRLVSPDFQATDDGGLGLGTVVTSGLFLAAIFVTVTYLAMTKKDVAATEIPE